MNSKLVAALFLSMAFSGLAFAQDVTTGFPVLQDANGLTVGPIVSFERDFFNGSLETLERINTVIYVDGVPYFLGINASDFAIGGPLLNAGVPYRVYFTSTNCTGTPFVVAESVVPHSFFVFAPVSDPQLAIYRPVAGAAVTPAVNFHSFISNHGSCIMQVNTTRDGIQAERITTPFVGPYNFARGPSTLSAALQLPIPTLTMPGKLLLVLAILLLGWSAIRDRNGWIVKPSR